MAGIITANLVGLTKANAGWLVTIAVNASGSASEVLLTHTAAATKPADAIEEARSWLYAFGADLAKTFDQEGSLR